ncbi:MAG: hypothetical protein PHU25_14130 [Deltaproteobacteria bacterium]|nr:hypothetical protein [Deltaproteobacteria bacterium]
MKGVLKTTTGAAIAAAFLWAQAAGAQTPTQPTQNAATPVKNQPVEATGTGIAGGIIAGTEIPLLIEAAIGVKATWALVVFPILGAGGGAAGGYFLEQASPEGSVGLLVGSMALIIPTAVALTVSLAYSPEDEAGVPDDASNAGKATFNTAPQSGEATSTEVEARPEGVSPGAAPPPAAESGAPAAPTAAPAPEPAPAPAPEPAPAPGGRSRVDRPAVRAGGLLSLDSDGSAAFGVPSVSIRSMPLTSEAIVLRQRPGYEINIPILDVRLP